MSLITQVQALALFARVGGPEAQPESARTFSRGLGWANFREAPRLPSRAVLFYAPGGSCPAHGAWERAIARDLTAVVLRVADVVDLWSKPEEDTVLEGSRRNTRGKSEG